MIELQLPSFVAFNLLNSRMRKFFAEQSNKWNEKGPWRFPSACYTLEHKLAFMEREHYLTGHYSLRGIFHDWEKPFLYLCPWITDEKKIQKMHRTFSPHHVGCKKTAKIEHLTEMYIDWDCAAITKPDKPLNAFETLVHFYPDFIDTLLPVCLVFEPEAVHPEIYLHPWHDLSQKLSYNRQIYDAVKNTLQRIVENWPMIKASLSSSSKPFRPKRGITHCSPVEIFILTVQKQRKNLNVDIDVEQLQSILEQTNACFQKQTFFAHRPHNKILHDSKEIKKYAFAQPKK